MADSDEEYEKQYLKLKMSSAGSRANIPRSDSSASGSKPKYPMPDPYVSGSRPKIPHPDASTSKTHTQCLWTLFKCTKCHIHFTFGWSAVKHLRKCHIKHETWQCELCHRTMALADQNVHSIQHSLSEKFYSIDLNDNITPKLIYKCVDCDMCFDSTSFRDYHNPNCPTSDKSRGECKVCDLVMHMSALEFHECYHKRFNLQSTYFIIVNIAHKMMQVNQKITFHQCTGCTVCFHEETVAIRHKNQPECLSLQLYKCQNCQLYFSHKHLHDSLHDRRAFTKQDIKLIPFNPVNKKNNDLATKDFYDDDKMLNPQDSTTVNTINGTNSTLKSGNQYRRTMYMCSECSLCFMTEESSSAHAHNHIALLPKDYITCDVCFCKFNYADIQEHRNRHLKGNSNVSNIMIVQLFGPKLRSQLESKLVINLAKKMPTPACSVDSSWKNNLTKSHNQLNFFRAQKV